MLARPRGKSHMMHVQRGVSMVAGVVLVLGTACSEAPAPTATQVPLAQAGARGVPAVPTQAALPTVVQPTPRVAQPTPVPQRSMAESRCAELADSPNDPDNVGAGVSFDKIDTAAALPVCEQAAREGGKTHFV